MTSSGDMIKTSGGAAPHSDGIDESSQSERELMAYASGREKGRWSETTAGIIYVVEDQVQFADDFHHWHEGFCRLLGIDEQLARRLIEEAVQFCADRKEVLLAQLPPRERLPFITAAADVTLGICTPNAKVDLLRFAPGVNGECADEVVATSIDGDNQRVIVGSSSLEYAWQADSRTGERILASSVSYDSSYYEKPSVPRLGMPRYSSDAVWRLEKARRMLRQILDLTQTDPLKKTGARPEDVQWLDVASAGGYMRKACDELSIRHEGIDISPDAAALCKEKFGFHTWVGAVLELGRFAQNRTFDIITLLDAIEHLDDPRATIKHLSGFLAPAGVLVVRTPNLVALEAAVLGCHYYSFKLDHTHYFSPRSLDACMSDAGFECAYMETSSHLFKGLLGHQYLYEIGKENRGADIFAIYRVRD